MRKAEAMAEMGEEDLLAYAERCAQTIREAETDLLSIAYQWAITRDRPASTRARATSRGGRRPGS